MHDSQALIVLFDGGCPVCRRTVRTLHRLDWLGRLQFANAMDDEMRARVAPSLTGGDVMQQMYVVDGRGQLSGGYEAQLQIGRRVPLLWILGVLGALPGIRQIGTRTYRYIAAHRRRQGVCSDELCSPQFRRGAGSPR
jgi:predicted DCC family thiol-disulfide oxidoreductase YuxK